MCCGAVAGFASVICGEGTPAGMLAGAERRKGDAEILTDAGRLGGALYLLGYVGEQCLTAACLELDGVGRQDVASLTRVKTLQADARSLKLMGTEPHDVAGWGRYVVYLRSQRGPGMSRELRLEVQSNADLLWEHWRPRLRYKAAVPTVAQYNEAKRAADWLFESRNDLRG